jgi:hypothetical protein
VVAMTHLQLQVFAHCYTRYKTITGGLESSRRPRSNLKVIQVHDGLHDGLEVETLACEADEPPVLTACFHQDWQHELALAFLDWVDAGSLGQQ